MEVIACCPGKGQFWIACNKEEAEKWFVPLLDERGLKKYRDILLMNESQQKNNPEYIQMIRSEMEVNEVAYAYFNVSRDLSVCYSEVAHHPFHPLWNAYSPFRLCDHVVINTPNELKNLVMTYKGKPFEGQ